MESIHWESETPEPLGKYAHISVAIGPGTKSFVPARQYEMEPLTAWRKTSHHAARVGVSGRRGATAAAAAQTAGRKALATGTQRQAAGLPGGDDVSAAAVAYPSRSWTPGLTKERKAEHDFRNLLMEYQIAVLDRDDNLVRFVLAELLKAYHERP